MNDYNHQDYPEAVSAYNSFVECFDVESIEWNLLHEDVKKSWVNISNSVLDTYAGNFDQIIIATPQALVQNDNAKTSVLKNTSIIIYSTLLLLTIAIIALSIYLG